jgi:ribosomal-protein-alanine N-acetyltransferase
MPMNSATLSVNPAPVCRVLVAEHASPMALFFDRLQKTGIEKFFHPHPLTAEEAVALANYSGRDFYCVMLQADAIIGYGMLRGWDEGYAIPSLGIAIDPLLQGRGYSHLLMDFLHTAARGRGATQVRLKVDPQNHRAIKLYRSLGYEFQKEKEEDGQLIGLLTLAPGNSPQENPNR